jgi:hypothetical protein
LRLLYCAGNSAADESFAAWLGHGSHQLDSLTICTCGDDILDMILGALADAGTAAAAAGKPLPLHTLRVLGSLKLDTTGRLLGSLVNIRTLQLSTPPTQEQSTWDLQGAELAQQYLSPLQQATQLRELYLRGPCAGRGYNHAVADLLPTSLQRLSWGTQPPGGDGLPTLSHLGQVKHLRLEAWIRYGLTSSSQLPPGLQELDLEYVHPPQELLLEQQGVLVGLHIPRSTTPPWSRFPGLQTVFLLAKELDEPTIAADLAEVANLSTISVVVQDVGDTARVQAPSAAAVPKLRHLQLQYWATPMITGLGALTQLTRLTVDLQGTADCSEEQQGAWTEQLGRLKGLRWLSVPAALLTAVQAAVGSMQQLQVLVLSRLWLGEGQESVLQQVMQWLEGSGLQALPPGLLLLGLSGVVLEQAASRQWRRRLQQVLGSSSRCEVVVGARLDEVCEPYKQLAGLPVELQQALA